MVWALYHQSMMEKYLLFTIPHFDLIRLIAKVYYSIGY